MNADGKSRIFILGSWAWRTHDAGRIRLFTRSRRSHLWQPTLTRLGQNGELWPGLVFPVRPITRQGFDRLQTFERARHAIFGRSEVRYAMTKRIADTTAKSDKPAAASAKKPNKGPFSLEIPKLGDVLVGELAHSGYWVVANVETNSFWPVNPQKQIYRGESIWILPITHKHFPAIAMRVRSVLDRADCERLLMRFLSTLSWVTEYGMSVASIGGGNLPRPIGRDKTFGISITKEFDLSYFPEPNNEKALLALALMREGRGLNHPGYAFLSFYRVLEVAFPAGRARGEWITNHVETLSDHRAKEALEKLSAQGVADIGVHLRDSGRRAIAHARVEPIIDPDDPADARRLSAELPIMTSLASLAIEEIFGVETTDTVYRKHLYELVGFKTILGLDTVARIARAEQIAQGTMIDITRISVRLRRQPPYNPLENLTPFEIGQDGSILFMRFRSDDGNLQIQFGLDFATERLEFDMFRDIAIQDSGTADGASAIVDCKRFLDAYFCNGQLEIYDAESETLLSRKDAYIPKNKLFNDDAAKAELARWEHLAAERRKSELSGG